MKNYKKVINEYGKDLLKSKGMKEEKNYIQHGNVTVFEHSMNVAVVSLKIADLVKIKINKKSMVRGALLHDYFLYDWHKKDPSHRLHGFTHANTALKNARKDFSLNEIEQDIIKKHMFPLNISIPKYKESFIVCVSDKICAVTETLFNKKFV